MAIKEKPTISAAASGITSAANPTVAQTIATQAIAKAQGSSTQQPLKAATLESRLKAETSAIAATSSTPKEDTPETEMSRWLFLQRTRQVEEDRAEAFDDINYHLFNHDEISKKGSLTTEDLLAADTRDPRVAGIPTLRVEENASSRYYVGNNLSTYLASNPQHTGRMTNIGEAQRAAHQSHFNQASVNVDFGGPTLINPRLAKAMRNDPAIAGYVEMTMNAAKRNGLDPVMLANQFYQESRFNPNAVSPAGAKGISQMMPFHVGKFGLTNSSDFKDPVKSIEAGAEMMGNLTRKLGDQRLALVAYNGGGKAIDFVEKAMGKSTVTFNEWQDFMSDRREKLGEANRSAWHVETLDYTRIIAGTPAAENKKPVAVASIAAPEPRPA